MTTLTNHVSLALGAMLVLAGCCMGGGADVPPTTDLTGMAPTSAVALGGPNPTTLVIGAPAVTVNVAETPRWTFAVATPGEYQFDAVGMPADAQLSILDANSWTVSSDSDSGDGLNARLATFLGAGSYTVRVNEYNHAAATVMMTVTVPPAFTSTATIAPGAPPTTVATPAGDWDRPSSAEITITIATAGNYRINSAAVGDSCTSRIELIQNNASLASNSYGGPNSSAQIDQAMGPGNYTLRLRDTIYRACVHSVTVGPQP